MKMEIFIILYRLRMYRKSVRILTMRKKRSMSTWRCLSLKRNTRVFQLTNGIKLKLRSKRLRKEERNC